MEEPSEANLVQLLDLRSADWKHPGRTRAVGPRAWHATSTAPWLFGHGGLVGSPMPRACGQACAAVNHFLKSRFPNGTWTSIAVLFNPRMGLHRDIQNMIDEGDATALVAGKFASVILAWRKKAGAPHPGHKKACSTEARAILFTPGAAQGTLVAGWRGPPRGVLARAEGASAAR